MKSGHDIDAHEHARVHQVFITISTADLPAHVFSHAALTLICSPTLPALDTTKTDTVIDILVDVDKVTVADPDP